MNFIYKNKPYMILIGLTILTLIFKIELIHGINFTLTSIITLLTLLVFGQRKAIISAIIFIILSIIVNGSYASLILIIEILVIYKFMNSFSKLDFMLSAIIFWGLVGTPIMYVISFFSREIGTIEFYYFDLMFLFVNGIFNAFIAEVIYKYLIERSLLKKEFSITFKEILLHILMAAILIPFIINIFVDIVKTEETIIGNISVYSDEVFDNVEDEIKSWKENEILDLQLSSEVTKAKLEKSIKTHSKYKPFNIYLKNKSNKIILEVKNNEHTADINLEYKNVQEYDDYLYKCEPLKKNKFLMNNWLDGFFVYEREVEGKNLFLMIEIPMSLYNKSILDEYSSQFKFFVFFILFISSMAMLLNKWVFNDLTIISENTKKFSKIMNVADDDLWPKSNIIEIKNLVENVRRMICELRLSFIELKKSEEMLYELAYYDNLTKIPNRLYFKKSLDELVQSIKNQEKIGIIFLDLNRFKVINDTLGHDVGDKLLVEVATRLSNLQNNRTQIFRLGGDEFVVVCQMQENTELNKVSEMIFEQFNRNFELDDLILSITCSAGASIYPDDSNKINTILQYADIAMYKSKEIGENILFLFDAETKESYLEKMVIEKEIFNALEKNEFELYYQPKYDSKSKNIKGIEALIRWSSPTLGMVPPNNFISIAEESDLILKIDEWVLTHACMENKKLQLEGFVKVPISVNISAKHFATDKIEEIIKSVLEKTSLEAKYLIIEITEGVLIKNFEIVEKIIRNLNRIGVSVSIDDFGKGYSSFNQLMELPINEIKIDKVFVRNVEKSFKKANILKTIVELGHGLYLNVVAEGVETEEEEKFLREVGCDELQGYYYTKPIEVESLKRIMKKKEREFIESN
ncbi:MAG: putative bifunctional diguanylate cyclase/phosphodiesterase [Sarcina sp.]